jgi:hypothetical protein
MEVQEGYTGNRIAANSTNNLICNNVAGFLADADGTITVTLLDTPNVVLLNAMAVVAGGYYPMPFRVNIPGVRIVTASGAAGCLFTA